MDERKLEALLVSVKLGSFSKAAAELGYTQSGLTYLMDSLEDELGVTLLTRTYSGVVPTEAGEALLPLARRALTALGDLSSTAKTLGGERRLRIGAYSSISVSRLPRVVAGFTSQNPGVKVELTVGDDAEISAKLGSGALELAFMDSYNIGGFDWVPLFETEMLAAVPNDCPIEGGEVSIERLREFPLIVYNGMPLRGLRASHASLSVSSPSDATAISMIEQGLGVGVMTSLSLDRPSPLIRVLRLTPPMYCTFGIAVRSLRLADALTRKFVSYCKKELHRDR